MKREGEQTLLRIFLRSTDRSGWSLASNALLKCAFRQKLAGATVLEAVAGIDLTGKLLQPRWWSLVRRVPIVVELTDRAEAIGPYLDSAITLITEGLFTLERAHVLAYRHGAGPGERPARTNHEVPARPCDYSYLPAGNEFPVMKQAEDAQLVRVFIDRSDVWRGLPLHEAILQKAQELGLASATVFRADSGFGAHHRLLSSRGEYVSDQPMVIEIIDATARIQTILPFLDEVIDEGLVTIEGVRMLRWKRVSYSPGDG